jgi:hypothetical protein
MIPTSPAATAMAMFESRVLFIFLSPIAGGRRMKITAA